MHGTLTALRKALFADPIESEVSVLSDAEQRALRAFQQYQVTVGQMLCFHGPKLKTYRSALRQLTEKELLVKEKFKGGYSLTSAGFAAMQGVE
jgi:hypothetical protein